MDEDRLSDPVELVVNVNGQPRPLRRASMPRPELLEKFGPGATGDYGFRLTFDRSLSGFQDYRIEVVEASTGQPLTNGSLTLTSPRRRPAPLRPIIVTSTGRAGTTLLMSEFVRHPLIVVANRFSYEIKLLSYYSAAFNVLTAHADRANSTNPDSMFDRLGQSRIGHNPFNAPNFFTIVRDSDRMARLFEHDIPEGYADLFAGFIREYYEVVRENEGKSSALHFAEKVDLDDVARFGPRTMFGEVREIVLTRDPRDLLCSAKSFWKLNSQDALNMIRTTVPRLFAITQSHLPDVLSVRYEDLVERPSESRAAIFSFLGIRDDQGPGGLGDEKLFGRHGTSKDPASSIGRWRTELSADEIGACERAFPRYMEAFGYAD
jgi:hypothetical protein